MGMGMGGQGPVEEEAPPPATDDVASGAFFAGDRAGTRNDFTGDVGIDFRANSDFTITQLGRHFDGAGLAEAKVVTLWSTATREALAQVTVGPDSSVEGKYAFAALEEAVTLTSGQEYRLSQQCTSGMRDRWYDAYDKSAGDAMSDYATFIGGVYNVGFGFPGNNDGAGRRAGLVNFKVRAAAQEAQEAPPPATVDVLFGKSSSNTKCVNAPGPVTCAVDAGDFGNRLNTDYSQARDTWEITTDGSQVCARRTDRNLGWGMQLKIGCVEAQEAPPPATVEVVFGKSSSNTKCVDAPGPVTCAVDAGDFGNRLNTDYSQARDTWEIT